MKVFHKKNGGLSDARNYGIERASGEFIACIDPDDYVDLDYIEYLFKLIKKYNTKMSVCQHRICYSLSLIHISEPTRQAEISYAVFCLKKKKNKKLKSSKK